MEHKILLPILLAAYIVLIFTLLLFLWVFPFGEATAAAAWFSSALILIHGVVSAAAWSFHGLQKAKPVLISGTAFVLAVLTACAGLLALEAPSETAGPVLTAFGFLYLICVGYLALRDAAQLRDWAAELLADFHPGLPSFRDWFRTAFRSLGPHRPGESQAERQVRIRREPPPDPPPLPRQRG